MNFTITSQSATMSPGDLLSDTRKSIYYNTECDTAGVAEWVDAADLKIYLPGRDDFEAT
jgi:hypothetical protein